MAIEHELIQVNGIGDAILNKLVAGGIETLIQLAEASLDHIVQMEIAPAIAGKIVDEAKKLLLEDKDKIAPSSRISVVRLKSKRHRARRHRKR